MTALQQQYPEARVAELRAAFQAVENPDNWKKPVVAVVPLAKLAITIQAIEFFAGSPTYLKFQGKMSGDCAIFAPGYYASVGT